MSKVIQDLITLTVFWSPKHKDNVNQDRLTWSNINQDRLTGTKLIHCSSG